MTSTATVATTSARRYLQQLCKHWAHEFPSEFTPQHGVMHLPFGGCVLDADDAGLRIRLEPKPEADPARFEAVVADHLRRFAVREQLQIDWVRAHAAV